jgi:hypothetical protein
VRHDVGAEHDVGMKPLRLDESRRVQPCDLEVMAQHHAGPADPDRLTPIECGRAIGATGDYSRLDAAPVTDHVVDQTLDPAMGWWIIRCQHQGSRLSGGWAGVHQGRPKGAFRATLSIMGTAYLEFGFFRIQEPNFQRSRDGLDTLASTSTQRPATPRQVGYEPADELAHRFVPQDTA